MLDVGLPELKGTLALAYEMARQVNQALVPIISHDQWALVVVEDFRERHPNKFKIKPQIFRSIQGYAKDLYGPVGLNAEELNDAYERIVTAEK